ncbi:anaerobic ribonucleoside-triphosphate reductase activating protein [Chitinilyticum piscinae]|uniref:Anaerobic ribonucleoside-triphosphate reductase activating protein n=1 Tax=Chitinilyticum piscinae TaxID=2866724 RepID=A0A8J7G0L5_9NEIS|nr:anaerobic ribonucleoside-triphosphate reductase activating protein [Chitinilyticum piscinae]MBE9609143.1 anaerobic ribonucleoside-triphosphate reductase activating protein [Chitinilyticum piscinae]
MSSAPPKLGGLIPFSSCDWPGKLAAVVFIAGCPWRCRYCHNPHLQQRENAPGIPDWPDLLAWLETRKNLLDGVVFSGGEALLEPRLPEMIAAVKAQGFAVALHTGGAYPARLKACLPMLDWVGFDVKALFADYAKVTGVPGSGAAARQSLSLLLASGVAFECRTTIHPELQSDAELLALSAELAELGVADYALQHFRQHGCQDPALCRHPVAVNYPLPATMQQVESRFRTFALRQA